MDITKIKTEELLEDLRIAFATREISELGRLAKMTEIRGFPVNETLAQAEEVIEKITKELARRNAPPPN